VGFSFLRIFQIKSLALLHLAQQDLENTQKRKTHIEDG
jgi:hypothetical protein